jgi:hypothetical protein
MSERLRATYASELMSDCHVGREALILHSLGMIIPPYRDTSGHVVSFRALNSISRDNLVPVAEYNLFRAIQTNLEILSIKINGTLCSFEGDITPFPRGFSDGSVPISLRPTQLQQSSVYEKWISVVPSPKMRDNLIRFQHLYTVAEFCSDLLGGLMGKSNDIEAGLFVWADPWDPNGWELTKGFVKKWGYLIEGCDDLITSTNNWRYLRGERPLFSRTGELRVEEVESCTSDGTGLT